MTRSESCRRPWSLHPHSPLPNDPLSLSNRMLKKSIHGFFNRGLASLAIWQSIHGLPGRVFFNTLPAILLLPAAVLAGGTWWADPDRIALGETVFDAKCMGCHHPEVKAFGPSFRWIASRRNPAEIYAYIVSPA